MSKEIIYTADIELSPSIIGLLNGTQMFYIENPHFRVEGVQPIDRKTYLAIKPGKQQQYGFMLNPVYLWVKTKKNKPYNDKFSIGYASTAGKPRDYYVMKPYEVSNIRDNVRQKLMVYPRSDPTPDDIKLLTLDYQLTMAMEVLLLASMLDINLARYGTLTDNKAFYTEFCNEINSILSKHCDMSEQEPFMVSDKYIASFLDPPIYATKSGKSIPLTELGKPKTELKSPMVLFHKIFEDEQLSSVQRFKPIACMVRENSYTLPSIRYIDYCKKGTSDHIKRFDSRLSFFIQLEPNDKGFNPNFKDFMLTIRPVSKGKYEALTPHDLSQLWGGGLSDQESEKGATQQGVIFIVPSLSFKFYKQGNPGVEWRVEKISCRRVLNSPMSNYDDGDEFAVGNTEGVPDTVNDRIQFIHDDGPLEPVDPNSDV